MLLYENPRGVIFIWYAIKYSANKYIETSLITYNEHKKQTEIPFFSLTFEQMRKYEGSWHLESRDMFPGFVFFDSREMDDFTNLKSRFLAPSGDFEETYDAILREHQQYEFIEIGEEGEHLLRHLFGEKNNLAMSKGVIRNGRTYVTEGPLKGYEHLITKINRHKRLAWLRLPQVELPGAFCAGLEITEKS